MRAFNLLLRTAAALLVSVGAAAQGLGIGDPAPRIDVKGFVKGTPVTSFERDTTYVVEFWATWCKPCRKTIPYLTELQKRFAGKNVRVIGVSVWEDRASDVAPFVEKMGEQMDYAVALDNVLPDAEPMQGAMARLWMRAAGEVSLPTVFIVDGAGRIAWIGDTLALDKPLEQIVAGTWDLAAAKQAHQQRSKINALGRKLAEQLKAGEWANALATTDEMNKLAPDSESRTGPWRFQCLLNLGREEEGYAYARQIVDGVLKDNAMSLNLVAWFVVDPQAARAPRRDLEFALKVAQRAVELSERKNGPILDTLALVHFTRGEVEKAIELQELAVELSAGTMWYEEVKARLEQFKRARKQSLQPIEDRR